MRGALGRFPEPFRPKTDRERALAEDSDGVIRLDDSESESSDEPQAPQPQRRGGITKATNGSQFAARVRQSAIQASAVTAAIVDVERESSSDSDLSGDDSDREAVLYAAKPRGRTKASAKRSRAAARKQPVKMSYAEYSKKRGLAHAAPRKDSDEDSSSSERERTRKRKRNRLSPRMDSDDDSEKESKHTGSFDLSDESDYQRPVRKPAHRPKMDSSRLKAPTAPPSHRSTPSHSQTKTKQQVKPKQPQQKKAAATSVSTAFTSLALRQSEQFSEVVTFSELQAQQRELARLHAQKKRTEAALAASSSSSSTIRKGEPAHARKASTSSTGTTSHSRSNSVSSSVTSASGPKRAKPLTKLAAKKAPVAPSTKIVVRVSSMRSTSGSTTQKPQPANKVDSTVAKLPTIANEAKLVMPVVHSTSWRGVYFTHAPPNLLTEVKTVPYSSGLWDVFRCVHSFHDANCCVSLFL